MADNQTTRQPNADNADDAYLDAKARVDKWLAEFQGNWYKPRMETAAKLMWNQQPEQVKEIVRQRKPDAAKKMDELLGGQ